jgi:hypothetical protein
MLILAYNFAYRGDNGCGSAAPGVLKLTLCCSLKQLLIAQAALHNGKYFPAFKGFLCMNPW